MSANMKTDQAFRLARDAGMVQLDGQTFPGHAVTPEALERFAELAFLAGRVAERAEQLPADVAAAVLAERDALASEMLTPDVFTRIVEWLREDPIRPAATAFTSGIERQIAYCLEMDVVPLIKSARIVRARDSVAERPVGPATKAALDAVFRDRPDYFDRVGQSAPAELGRYGIPDPEGGN